MTVLQTWTVSREQNEILTAGNVARSMHAVCEAGDLLTACGWCRWVHLDGTWLRPPRAAMLATEQRFAVTFTICPGCLVKEALVGRA
jgi:hypothetical protein